MGFERAGLQCKWQVEIDDYATRVLEKHWPDVARFRDVRECGAHNLEWVDVICGGFPCQDISLAGNMEGIGGARSGLWGEFARLIRDMGPRIAVVENVAALLVFGMDTVLSDLAEAGYDAEWDCLPACAFGAPHSRDRVFIVAHRGQERWNCPGRNPNRINGVHPRQWNGKATPESGEWRNVERWLVATFQDGDWESPETAIQRMDDGVPYWLARNGLAGNAVVPQIAEWIGRRLIEATNEE